MTKPTLILDIRSSSYHRCKVNRRQAIRVIKAAGKHGTVQENGRWRVTGRDLDGHDLTVIVSIDAQGKVIAWTTF